MTEEDKSKQINNLKRKFRISIVFILILSFISYTQWVSRTEIYINGRSNLSINIALYKLSIERYIIHDNVGFLYDANSYATAITLQSRIFQYYYRNQFGYDLRRNLNEIFSTSNFNVFVADSDALSQKVQDVELILSAIDQGEKPMSYTNRYTLFPKNPFTKKRDKELMLVTEEIINIESEKGN